MFLRVTGGNSLRAVARDLRSAGAPARGIRSKMRRNIVAAVKPMQQAVKSNALAIPAKGPDSTGLRRALASSTRIRIRASGRTALVRLEVDHPLSSLMEGSDGARRVNWRHPVWEKGARGTAPWVSQQSHPFFEPAVTPRIPLVRKAVVAAVEETAIRIERGV